MTLLPRIATAAFATFAAIAALTVASAARAQTFPARPVTIVIPFPPGGISDTTTRVIGAKFTENTGQSVVVENRPGAGGQIGADAVKRARPDGYTLYLANIGSHGINQSLYSKLSYDPVKDFEPITVLFSSANLLLVPAGHPVKTLAELIAFAKERPGKVSYASQSIGSGGHLAGEIVKARNGLDLVHVPYKGSAPALTDLVAGRVDFLFDPFISALPFVRDGKLRALGTTGERRSALAPDIPTLRELGFPGYDVNPWFGLAAPAGTPRAVIERAQAEFVRALRAPEVTKRLADQGIDPVGNTPEEFARFIQTETARWTQVVVTSGAKAD